MTNKDRETAKQLIDDVDELLARAYSRSNGLVNFMYKEFVEKGHVDSFPIDEESFEHKVATRVYAEIMSPIERIEHSIREIVEQLKKGE